MTRGNEITRGKVSDDCQSCILTFFFLSVWNQSHGFVWSSWFLSKKKKSLNKANTEVFGVFFNNPTSHKSSTLSKSTAKLHLSSQVDIKAIKKEQFGTERGFGLSIRAGINPKALKPSSVWTLGTQHTFTHTLQTDASSSLCLHRTPGALNPVQHQHASCPYSQTLSATMTLQQVRYVYIA